MSDNLLFDPAERPLAGLLLAHGAGAPVDSDFMNAIATRLAASGVSTVRFEFPYMARRRREGVRAPPDRAPKLLAHFRKVMARVAAMEPALPLWVGGKSMGGRMATLLAADGETPPPAGCVVFGYPFHPPGKPEKTRLDPFPDLRVPTLICQGERDPFGKAVEVSAYGLPSTVTLEWLPDGDHDFRPRKRSGVTHDDNLQRAAECAAAFVIRRIGVRCEASR